MGDRHRSDDRQPEPHAAPTDGDGSWSARRRLRSGEGDPLVRRQFLAEALLLSGAGGLGGVVLGGAITAAYAAGRSWGLSVPLPALAGDMGAALLIGAGAGLYPALRAARLAPTEALRT